MGLENGFRGRPLNGGLHVSDYRRVRFVTILFALGAFGSLLTAQEGMQREGRGGPPAKLPPVHRVGGARDGVSAFPMVDYAQLKPLKAGEVDFKHYHSYEETTALLKSWAAKYPQLVDLYSVGQSFEGREIWQITITNKKAGKDTDKPAFFLEGGRHAGEISGIEASLYFINYVLSGYGVDPALTALVDTKALYVKPSNNPDGNTLYHLTAQTLRSTVRPYDSDGDGLLDEDAGEDLDGDGYIRQMRRYVGTGKGNAVKDPKDARGRAMKRVPQGQGDYELFRKVSTTTSTAATTKMASAGSICTATTPRTGAPCVKRPGEATRRAARQVARSRGARNPGCLPVPDDPSECGPGAVARHRGPDDPARALHGVDRGRRCTRKTPPSRRSSTGKVWRSPAIPGPATPIMSTPRAAA